jgi:hypothetical protein
MRPGGRYDFVLSLAGLVDVYMHEANTKLERDDFVSVIVLSGCPRALPENPGKSLN